MFLQHLVLPWKTPACWCMAVWWSTASTRETSTSFRPPNGSGRSCARSRRGTARRPARVWGTVSRWWGKKSTSLGALQRRTGSQISHCTVIILMWENSGIWKGGGVIDWFFCNEEKNSNQKFPRCIQMFLHVFCEYFVVYFRDEFLTRKKSRRINKEGIIFLTKTEDYKVK